MNQNVTHTSASTCGRAGYYFERKQNPVNYFFKKIFLVYLKKTKVKYKLFKKKKEKEIIQKQNEVK